MHATPPRGRPGADGARGDHGSNGRMKGEHHRIGEAFGERQQGFEVHEVDIRTHVKCFGGFTKERWCPAVEVTAGGEHSIVRLQNGELWSFGSNRVGQLGLPWIAIEDQRDWSVPAQVDGPPSGCSGPGVR